MLRISLFECSFSQSDVVLFCVVFVCGHVGFVDYTGDEAVVVQRALVFFSTIASVLRCGVVVGKDFLVVVVDDAAHVRHAAVADFHVVFVKDGVQILVWWEVFLDQVEEGFSYVGLDIFPVWGFKPDDASFSISFRGCGCVFLAVVKVCVKST